jgi:hypothetical protein
LSENGGAYINTNTFDANYYFASDVSSFFEAPQINSPRLINNYWNTQFAKLFAHMQVRMQFDSMRVQDKVDHYCVYIPMYSDYYQTDIKQQITNERSENYFELDRDFMIMRVTQKVWKETE